MPAEVDPFVPRSGDDDLGAQPDASAERGLSAAAEFAHDPADVPAFVPEPLLPEPVRTRVIALAAAAMTQIPAGELPVPLRRVAKFAPNRRARMGAGPIATQLTGDPLFRQRVAARVIEEVGALATAVRDGGIPGSADPVEVAALAYLIRPEGWTELVADVADLVRSDADLAAIDARVADAETRAARAEHDRAVARVEADKLRDETARLREEVAALREEARSLSKALRETQAKEKRASELVATERGRITRSAADHEAELRRLRARLAEAEASTGAARAASSRARQVDDARLWLLLETIGQAAIGLRRELALEPATVLPADLVADEAAASAGGATGGDARGMEADDPVRLDRLLALPKAHLIVDGYNVTKAGFGEMSLEQQRNRLVSALAGLTAQTGTETTIVFDGADRIVGLPPAPRGVRVLFSRKGETADDLIRRLVRAEPAGRAVVVISSDREVADGVRRHGAYPLSSETLLRRIARS